MPNTTGLQISEALGGGVFLLSLGICRANETAWYSRKKVQALEILTKID